MTRKLLSLIGGALLFAPMVMGGAQAQQRPLERDPADTRIQGSVQPITPMGSPGTRPVGRAIGRIGGSDEWADSGGEASRPQGSDRPPLEQGSTALTPYSAHGITGGGGYNAVMEPVR